MKRTAAALILCLCCLRPLIADALAAPTISARRAVVTDALSGAALYEKNADTKSRIASTTKILTALVVAERCDPDETVVIPPEAAGIEGSSMYLQSGERLTVRELLYGLLLVSGNDAAAALALHCTGSEAAFAALMNEKARELGAADSRFVNPHGLDAEGHFSTARDLATIAAAAMEVPLLREITATKQMQIGDRTLVNHNKLLWRGRDVVGVKTGYTRAAGRILVSAAERDGRRLIAVTIDDPDDWNDHLALLEEGYAHFTVRTLVGAGEQVLHTALLDGTRLCLTAAEDVAYPLLPGERPRAVLRLPGAAWSAGDYQAAELVFFLYGKRIGSARLKAEEPDEDEIAEAPFRIWGLLPPGSGEAA